MLENLLKPYVLSGLVGFLLAAVVVFVIKRKKPYIQAVWVGYFAAIAGMFIGAHLLYFLVGLPDFINNFSENVYSISSFLETLAAAGSGMVFYGGVLGAMLGIIIFCKKFSLPVRPYLNIGCCVFPLIHAFGRIGCTLTGCCYGIEYHGILAIQYTSDVISPGVNDHIADFPRFPVQPLEAACELIIFAVILILYFKTENKYSLTAIYLSVYAVIRFSDEYLRGDSIRGTWGPFSTSQWIALFCLIGAGIYYFKTRKNRA